MIGGGERGVGLGRFLLLLLGGGEEGGVGSVSLLGAGEGALVEDSSITTLGPSILYLVTVMLFMCLVSSGALWGERGPCKRMKSSSERGERRELMESIPQTIWSSSSDDKSSVTRV